jgi:hypothetical protein
VTDAHTRVASLKDLEEEAEESEEDNRSLLNKLKNVLGKGKKSSSKENEEEDEADVEDADAQKKKKIRLFVLAGIVIAVLFLIPDEQENPPAPEVPVLKERPYKKTLKQDVPKEDSVETPVPTESPVDTPVVEAAPSETPEDSVEANPEEPIEAKPDIVTESPGESESPDSFGEGSIPSSPIEDSDTDMESNIVTDEPVPTESNDFDSVGGEEPTVDDSSTIGETSPDLTEQILQDLEDQEKVRKETREPVTTYVAPPPYQFSGRGLVYNCKGKHWACVDGGSYRICEDNFSGNQYLKKNNECYPFNVYQSESGCEIMQKRMVTSSAKTNFCND